MPGSGSCSVLPRVRMTYVTELPEAEVRAFYQDRSVRGVDGGRALLTVFWQGGDPRATYIVEAWQVTDPGLDVRCH